MSAWVVTQGRAVVSVGTVLADPLPAGLVATPLSTEQWASIVAGGTWDVGTQSVVPPPDAGPDFEDELMLGVLA